MLGNEKNNVMIQSIYIMTKYQQEKDLAYRSVNQTQGFIQSGSNQEYKGLSKIYAYIQYLV